MVNVGAPKGASRLMQRIGRANHRLDEPRKALLVPANRFEILECRAALDAVDEAAQDTPKRASARWTCSRSTCSAWPARAGSTPTRSMREVTAAAPYAELTREDFDAHRRLRRHRRLCAEEL